jgi:hypothetical protein
MKKRLFGLAAATAFAITAIAAPAAAFNPPGSSTQFGDGSPGDFPGADGQYQAMDTTNFAGTWAAHVNGQIEP